MMLVNRCTLCSDAYLDFVKYNTSFDFLGKEIDGNLAMKIAEGKVDARSLTTS